jgi:NAD(P)-dependent dehydrogenase (short-subunit alcohol dehydrogenase family)
MIKNNLDSAFICAKSQSNQMTRQRAAVFLSSEASDYVTGIDLVIDGGYLAW